MRTDRPETAGGGSRGMGGRPVAKGDGTSSGRGRLSVSTRSSELDSKTKRTVKKQNKAAESYKIKDMDAAEKGAKYRAEKKIKDAAIKAKELKAAETKGKIKGAAATVGVGITAAALDKKKKSGKK